ncbi:putative NAD dependent epimerase/dehydratase [Aspergillus carlsbadensis]|nr:putative NAD dependent epimerase/dehydratase [Aspergillus carlsbadensis]
MAKIIAITGITGVQGGSIANTYLTLPGYAVRGLTRTPSSPKALEWASRGVEIVQADLNDPASLASALRGACLIFGVTDFWTIFSDSASMTEKKAEQDITEYAFEVEVAQGKNLADAAAKVEGLERFVFSSMASAKRASGGKFSRLFHMDSKAVVVEHAKALEGLQGKFSIIQAPIYFNLLWEWGLPTTPKKQPDGTYTFLPIGQLNVPIPFGDVAADFGACAKAVFDAPPGTNLLAVGEMMSWETYIETWCARQGVPVGQYKGHTIEEYEELLPGGLGREFGENVLFAQEFGYDGREEGVVRPEQFGTKMTSFREYCEKTDFSAIL